jgi:hypothetical protein
LACSLIFFSSSRQPLPGRARTAARRSPPGWGVSLSPFNKKGCKIFFARRRTRKTRNANRTRLQLEVLEDRVVPSFTGYTPAQVRHAYGFDAVNQFNGAPANGAGQTIAIVDAGTDPNVL